MNSQVKWYIGWGLRMFWAEEFLFLWSHGVSHSWFMDLFTNLKALCPLLMEISWRRPPISSVQSLSCVRLFVTPWTAARQASLSITNSQIRHDQLLTLFPVPSPLYRSGDGRQKWVNFFSNILQYILCLSILRATTLFSTVTVPFYILTTKARC